VIVEMWPVLDSIVPSEAKGAVKADISGAQTPDGNKIPGFGRQDIQLHNVENFVSPVLNLSLQKLPSPTIFTHVGQNITYNYTVTNDASTSEGVIGGPINITDNQTTNSLPYTISDVGLPIGTNVTGSLNYTITQQDFDAGYVTNLANATGISNNALVHSNDTIAKITAFAQNPALNITKSQSEQNYGV